MNTQDTLDKNLIIKASWDISIEMKEYLGMQDVL